MRVKKWMAALLALCLLLALIPAATTEVVEVEDGAFVPQTLTDEVEDVAEEPAEGDEAIDAQPLEDWDLGGLEIDGAGEAAANETEGSLVQITKPANGGTVNTGTIEVWCRFVNDDPTGGFSSDNVWKYLGVNYELLKNGARIDLGVLNSYSGLVFVDDGLKVGSITIKSSGSYTLRASVPGSPDVWDSVDFKVIGATITPEPTPEPTPVPKIGRAS